MITDPPPASTIGTGGTAPDTVKVKGISWSGAGVGMARVDVSANGGKTWTGADFADKPADVEARESWCRVWSWFLFEKEIQLTPDVKEKLRKGEKVELLLTSKGVDNAFNVQPPHTSVRDYYNARGVVVNHQYAVPVTLDPKMRKGAVKLVEGQDHLNPPTGGHFLRPWNEHGFDSPEAKRHEEIVKAAKKK